MFFRGCELITAATVANVSLVVFETRDSGLNICGSTEDVGPDCIFVRLTESPDTRVRSHFERLLPMATLHTLQQDARKLLEEKQRELHEQERKAVVEALAARETLGNIQ